MIPKRKALEPDLYKFLQAKGSLDLGRVVSGCFVVRPFFVTEKGSGFSSFMAFFFWRGGGESLFFVGKIRFQLVQNQLFFGEGWESRCFFLFFFWGGWRKSIFFFWCGGSRKLKEM